MENRLGGSRGVGPVSSLAGSPVPESVLSAVEKRLANVRCTLQEVRERMRVKDAQLFGESVKATEAKPEPTQMPGVMGGLLMQARQLDDLAADVLLAVAKYEAV